MISLFGAFVKPFQFTPLREGRRDAPWRVSAGSAFQFTPLREGRPHSAAVRCFSAAFQFTPLREGRLPGVRESGRRENFNSRPSARGDGIAELACRRLAISIHAPPRGATTPQAGQDDSVPFQFTPLREGRPLWDVKGSSGDTFQFTPLREGRRMDKINYKSFCYFNSRPSARGDSRRPGVRASGKFQFTPLREGRRQKICNFCKSFVQPLQISMA